MKTQLIPLESHDDAVSIRDKMSWAKTPRILLVWPSRERVDIRPLDLALLRRHAVSLGAELGLVTRDAEIRAAAHQMDLPVFSKASLAQRKTWPMRVSIHPERRAPRLDLRDLRASLPDIEIFPDLSAATRLVIFSVGVLAVLFIPLFLMPSAEIRMDAPTDIQSVEIDVSAEPDATQISLAGVVPSRLLTFDFTLSDSMPVSGQTVVADQFAEGSVRFTNLSNTDVDVPAETVVLTLSDPPMRFATLEDVNVPIGKGSIAFARVHALAPGTVGNVATGTVTAFEGPLGLSLAVINLSAMHGGTDQTASIPTDADRQKLHERLLASIKDQAASRLPQQVKPGDVVFPTSLAFSKILDETYTPESEKAARRLELTMRAEFHVYYAAADDLSQLSAQVLDASLAAGYQPVDGTLTVTPASPLFGGVDGLARWRMRASRTLHARIDPAQVISIARGQPAGRAQSLLQETFGLESAPQISIQPFFWPWLPSLPFRIKVTG